MFIGWPRRLESGEFTVNTLPVGETAIPVASAKHLFRTPSLGGQERGSTTHLLAIFLGHLTGGHCAHRIANTVPAQQFVLRGAPSVSSIGLSGNERQKGWAECRNQNSGWRWHVWAALPHVATLWANKRLSAAPLAQALQWFWMETLQQARQLGQQAIFSIASNTHDSAKPQTLSFAGAQPGNDQFETSRAACELTLARGFLRGTLPKTKDVPCSKRS